MFAGRSFSSFGNWPKSFTSKTTSGPTTISTPGAKSASCKAQFKEPHQDWIQSVHFEIQVPRVMRLLHYDRVPKQRVRLNRRNIFARDGNLCQYCGKRFATSELSLDHVVPTCRGGRYFVGESGVRLRAVQRPQRRPHAARSRHPLDQGAGAPEAQPAADDQARQPEVRELEDLPGYGVLVGGFEVAASVVRSLCNPTNDND